MRIAGSKTITGLAIGFALAAASAGAVVWTLNTLAPPADPVEDASAIDIAKTQGAKSVTRPHGVASHAERERASESEMRRVLARSIQQELTRAGCYSGAIDGDWNDATQRAMREFQASGRGTTFSVATTAPDYVHITMLQSRPDTVCGEHPSSSATAGAGLSDQASGATSSSTDQPSKTITVLAPAPAIPVLGPTASPAEQRWAEPAHSAPRGMDAAPASASMIVTGSTDGEHRLTAAPSPVVPELDAAPAETAQPQAQSQRQPRQSAKTSPGGRASRDTFLQISRDAP